MYLPDTLQTSRSLSYFYFYLLLHYGCFRCMTIMPSFKTFYDGLTCEQSKLTQMDSLTGSQSQPLLAKPPQSTLKLKQISDSSSQPSTGPSSSSKKEKKKTETPTCSYCRKGLHDESRCFQKRFDGYEE